MVGKDREPRPFRRQAGARIDMSEGQIDELREIVRDRDFLNRPATKIAKPWAASRAERPTRSRLNCGIISAW